MVKSIKQETAGARAPAATKTTRKKVARAVKTALSREHDAGADWGLRLYITRIMMDMSPRVYRYGEPGEPRNLFSRGWFAEHCADVAVIISGRTLKLHSTAVSAEDWKALNAIVRAHRRTFFKRAKKLTDDSGKIVIILGLWPHSTGDIPSELGIYTQVTRDKADARREARELAEEDSKSHRILLS